MSCTSLVHLYMTIHMKTIHIPIQHFLQRYIKSVYAAYSDAYAFRILHVHEQPKYHYDSLMCVWEATVYGKRQLYATIYYVHQSYESYHDIKKTMDNVIRTWWKKGTDVHIIVSDACKNNTIDIKQLLAFEAYKIEQGFMSEDKSEDKLFLLSTIGCYIYMKGLFCIPTYYWMYPMDISFKGLKVFSYHIDTHSIVDPITTTYEDTL